MAPRICHWLLLIVLGLALVGHVQPALADTPTPTDTATPTATATPIPTATPDYQTTYALNSGDTLLVERRWTFGELAIFLAIVANTALNGLRWMYEVTYREGHRVQEVRETKEVQEVRIVD